MERRDLLLGGLKVRYYEAGSGPAVVLVHGAGASGKIWRKQFGPLSENFHVIAPDLPGFGGSGFSQAITGVCGYSGFLLSFLDALKIDAVSLVGSSMGGWASCCLAAARPDRVERLVLISAGGLYLPEAPPMPIPRLLEYITSYYPEEGSAELTNSLKTINSLWRSSGFAPDVKELLPAIKALALVVWGENDPVIPMKYAEVFASEIKGARLEIIKGAGHMPYLERPEETNRIIANFLR